MSSAMSSSNDILLSFDLDVLEEMTEEEILEYREVFALFDKDNDGHISHSELAAALKVLGQYPTDAEIREMIRSIDRNDDGFIDFAEFLNLIHHSIQHDDENLEERTVEAFKAFDKDGNGLISATELQMVLASLGQDLSEKEVMEMITEIDKDGDGQVNFCEFLQMLSKQ